MIDLQTFLLFFPAALLLALSPGPDNLFVMAQSAQNGRRAGLVVTLGLSTGLIGHTLAVAFGLAAVISASAMAFTLLKGAGAAYLFFLAWQAWRSGGAAGKGPEVPQLSTRALFGRGIVMNLGNPKVSLFFLAFLPQFADPSRGSMAAQFLQLGMLFIVATMLVFGAFSQLAGGLGERFRNSSSAVRAVNRAASLIFVALAVRLAMSER
jgi:threonine/homoserine/homoserine lactone efflux protein